MSPGTAKTLADSFEEAKRAMREVGFEVGGALRVLVDKGLPFMGYSSAALEGDFIVDSGFAARSPMLKGLLVHELSHVYRTTKNHPSHNNLVTLVAIGGFLRRHGLDREYQHKAVHQAVNHLQDLYADDVAVKVLGRSREEMVTADQLGDFFLSWVSEGPERSGDAQRGRWVNTSLMLRNAFALSDMKRHGIEDVGREAEGRNQRFLSRLRPEAAKRFGYFHDLMTNLKEDITEDEYRRELERYLEALYGLVELI